MQARAWLPAAFQLFLSGMCVSVSGLQPSPSAPTQLSICQHKTKRAQVCFPVASLISLSNTHLILPLHHLLCTQRHTNKEKGLVATAQADSTPKHSAWVWLLDVLQALSFCAAALSPAANRVAPRNVPTDAPWPYLPCSRWPHCSCQPDPLSHSSHLYATSITGIQMILQAPPAAFTWHPHSSPTTTSDTRRTRSRSTVLLSKQGGQNLLSTGCQAILLHIKPSFLQAARGDLAVPLHSSIAKMVT